MTDERKHRETGERLRRLSEIRSELTVERRALRDMRDALTAAGAKADTLGTRFEEAPETWPTPDAFYAATRRLRDLKREADDLIRELHGLGIDADLFRLNGDEGEG